MKAFFTTLLLFPLMLAYGQTNSGSLEDQVKTLLVEDRYKDAVELCERKMQDDRHGAFPYFMLAEVYLRSLPYCGGAEFTDYLLASLALGVYNQGSEKFNKHDPRVLRKICGRLATMEDIFNNNLNTDETYAVDCFGRSTTLYTKSQCQEYFDK